MKDYTLSLMNFLMNEISITELNALVTDFRSKTRLNQPFGTWHVELATRAGRAVPTRPTSGVGYALVDPERMHA